MQKGIKRHLQGGPALEPPPGGAQSLGSPAVPLPAQGTTCLCLHSSAEACSVFFLSLGAFTPHLLPILPQVVCAKCSDYRAELKYDDNRPNRVCFHCYTFLTGNVLPEDREDRRRGILEVRARGHHSANACGALRELALSWVLKNRPAGVTLPILLSAHLPGRGEAPTPTPTHPSRTWLPRRKVVPFMDL